MNITGGGIHFEIGATNESLIRVLEQSKRAMQGFTGSLKTGGGDIDAAFQQVTQGIAKTRAELDKVDIAWTQTMDNLRAKLEETKAARDQAWATGDDRTMALMQQQTKEIERQISAYEKVGQEISKAFGELDAQEASAKRQYDQAKQQENVHVSIRTQLAKAKNELMEMERAGQRGTEAYEKQQAEVVRLAQAMASANKQQKALANPNRNFQAVIGGLTLVTSSYQAVTGAIGLFAGENENLQKVMVKVQSIMSITMALQTAYTQLNKNSAFQLVAVAKAKDLLTAANTRLAAALSISTAAAAALMATLTLGLSAAITLIVVAIEKMRSKQEEARKTQEEFNAEVARAAGEPLAAYMELRAEWLNLSNDLKTREQWVQDNADRFDDLGVSVNSARQAEEFLQANTQAFVNSCMAKAKALAAQKIAAEKYEEYLKKQAEADQQSDTKQQYVPGMGGAGYYIEVKNTKKEKLQKEADDLKKAGDEYINKQVGFTEESNAELKKLGDIAQKTIAGSVQAVKKEVNALQQQYDRAGTQAERTEIGKKLAAKQKELSAMEYKATGSGKKTGKKTGGGGGTTKDEFSENLKKKKELYAQYSKWVQSEDATVRAAAAEEFKGLLAEGTSYIDYLEKQRAGIEGKANKTATDLKNLSKLNAEIAEQTKKTVLSDFENQLNQQLSECKTLSQQLEVIANARKELSGDNSELDTGKAKILGVAQDSAIKQAKQETEQLLQQYAAYQNERLQFEESFARKRELLTNMIKAKEIDTNDEYIAGILEKKKQYEQYAQEVQSDDETIRRSAKQRYADLLKDGTSYLDMLRRKIADLEKKQMTVGLTVEGTEELEKLKAVLNSENTSDAQIKAAQAALDELNKKAKEYAKQSDSEQYDEMLERYKSYQQQISDIHEKYSEERALAEKNENYQMLAEINAAEQQELSKAATEKLMASDSWNQLFSDLSKLSKDTIRRLIEEINANKIELSANLSPTDLQAINEQLEKAEEELKNSDPFSVLKQSLKELSRTMKANKLLNSDDPFIKNLLQKKKQYKQYTEAIQSGDKTLAAAAKEEFASLLSEGQTYIDNLKRRIQELEGKKITLGLSIDETETLNKLNVLLDKEVGAIGELNGENFQKVMEAGSGLANSFKSITDSMRSLAEATGNEALATAADAADDIIGNFEAAEKGAETWGGWWGAIIGGVTDGLPKLVSWINGDKKLEKQIANHAKTVKKLQAAYNALNYEVQKSLGENVYTNQKALIKNLRAQNVELEQMIAKEKEKKKTDWDAVAEYEEQIAENARSIQDIIDSITESVTQTTAGDLANNLADALVEAWEEGTSAAEAFGEVAEDVLATAVKNALKLQFLEQPLQQAIQQLQRDMGFDEEGNGTFDGLTAEEQQKFKDAVQQAGANFNEAMKVYQDLFDGLEDSDPSTLSGALKTASQESIDLLAGQMNAVRMNQVTALAVFREQLMHLSNMDNSLGVISARLVSIINYLSTPADDGLRGQGITT